MSDPTNTVPGDFVWYELFTTNPKAAVAFYEHVVGWSSSAMEHADEYTFFVSAQGPLGGATRLSEQAKQMGAPPHWMANVQVENVDATLAVALESGAKVQVGPMEYPGVGRFAIILDPWGAPISMFAPSKSMPARDRSKSGEVSWHELLAADHVAALAFYAKIFGWQQRSVFNMGPMGDYILYGNAERDLGGMFTKPKDVPASAWLYYIEVSDLDAAVERAKEKGAKLCHGPMEVPGGARIAQLADPEGAMFALHERKAESVTQQKTA